MKKLTHITLTLALAALAACGGSNNGPTAAGGDGRTITASPSLAFGPSSLTVTAGQTVTFAFGSVPHNVFFDAQAGAPSNIDGSNSNVSVVRVFSTPGTYTYSCHIHPSMHGTVVVN